MSNQNSATLPKCKCNHPGEFFCLDHLIYLCDKELPKHKCPHKKTKDLQHDMKQSLKKLEKDFPVWKTSLLGQMQEHIGASLLIFEDIRKEILQGINNIFEGYHRQFKMLIESKVMQERRELVEKMESVGKSQNLPEWLSLFPTDATSLEKSARDAKFHFEHDEIFKLVKDFSSLISKQIGSVAAIIDSKPILDKHENLEEEIQLCISNLIFSESRQFLVSNNAQNKKEAPKTRTNGILQLDTMINTYISKETMALKNKGVNNSSMKNQVRQMVSEPINESLIESQRSFGNIDDFASNKEIENVESVQNEKFDFDLGDEDFDFGDDEILEKEHKTDDIKTVFENSQQKLMRILDRVLYDINCPGFYDKSFRESANSYMDKFKETMESVLKEVKNNFNRL